MRNRLELSGLLVAVLVCLALSACGAPDRSGPPAQPAPLQPAPLQPAPLQQPAPTPLDQRLIGTWRGNHPFEDGATMDYVFSADGTCTTDTPQFGGAAGTWRVASADGPTLVIWLTFAESGNVDKAVFVFDGDAACTVEWNDNGRPWPFKRVAP